MKWLDEYFPFIDSKKIVFCNDKSLIRADVLIDDGWHNLVNFEGIKILYDYPYNQEVRNLRVKSWNEILKVLGGLR